jgi:hypothetical protein
MDLNHESVAPGGKQFAGLRHSNLSQTVKIDHGCGIRIGRCGLLPVLGSLRIGRSTLFSVRTSSVGTSYDPSLGTTLPLAARRRSHADLPRRQVRISCSHLSCSHLSCSHLSYSHRQPKSCRWESAMMGGACAISCDHSRKPGVVKVQEQKSRRAKEQEQRSKQQSSVKRVIRSEAAT